MTDTLNQIVADFEGDLIASVRCGASEAKLESLFDGAVYRLRLLKEGASSQVLEAIFSAFFEMETKLKMAMETIKS
ncbi:hypothetical protein [Bradyrhizobium ottawaense]